MNSVHAHLPLILCPLLLLGSASSSRGVIIIDTFDTNQDEIVFNAATGIPEENNGALQNEIIADEMFIGSRAIGAKAINITDEGAVTVSIANGTLNITKTGSIGYWDSVVIWGSNPASQQEIDITEGGQSDQFRLDISSYSGGGDLTFYIFDTNANYSMGIIPLPESVSGGGLYHLMFSELIGDPEAPIDFTRVTYFMIGSLNQDPDDPNPTPRDFSLSINDVRIIPEPTAASLFVLSAVCLAGRRRRRM